MNSISLQRLRLTVQSVSPGGKCFGRLHHSFDQQAGKDFAVQPGPRTRRVFFRQMPQAHDRFHSLEGEFNLPAKSVQFQYRWRPETISKCGPDEKILGCLPRLRANLLLFLAGVALQTMSRQARGFSASLDGYQSSEYPSAVWVLYLCGPLLWLSNLHFAEQPEHIQLILPGVKDGQPFFGSPESLENRDRTQLHPQVPGPNGRLDQ